MSDTHGEQPAVGTESDILASIDAAEADVQHQPYGSEPTDAQLADIEGTSPPQQPEAGAQGEQGIAPQQQQAGAGDQKDGSGQDQQPTQQPTQQAGDPPTKRDEKGNVVNADTGELIAAAGAERRVFERNTQLRAENDRLTGMLRQQAEAIDKLNVLNGQPAQLGLSPQEVDVGLRVINQFKQNPVEAARFVVAEAMKLGHNLETIIGNNDGTTRGIEMGAVKGMIDEKLSAVTQDRQAREQQEQQARIDAETEAAYHRFLDDHEHSAVHEDAIARLMTTQNLTPEVAYWRLRSWTQENGYDFAQPLGPQITARQQESGPPGNPQPAPQNGSSPQPPVQRMPAPMPAGSAPGGLVSTRQHENDAGMDPDADYDVIVRQAMLETGYN